MLEKTFESPLDCKEIKPVSSKGNQPWALLGRTDAEAPTLWPPDTHSQLIGKDSDATKAQFSHSCQTLCDPVYCSTSGFPVHQQLLELAQIMSIESVMSSKHLILCHLLLVLPSIFPSIRVFSNESLILCIRWPKYWSFNFQHQSFPWILRVDFL